MVIRLLSDVFTVTGTSVSAGIVTELARQIAAVVIYSFTGGISDNMLVLSCKWSVAINISSVRKCKGPVLLPIQKLLCMYQSINVVPKTRALPGCEPLQAMNQAENLPSEQSGACIRLWISLVSSLLEVSASTVVGLASSIAVVGTCR